MGDRVLEQAINNVPPYLIPFKAKDLTTNFLREGIKWTNLTEEQREQLQEQDDNAESDGATLSRTQFLKYLKKVVTENEQRKTQYLHSGI